MHTSTFSGSQLIPRPLEEVFDFFSMAKNLGRLTPPWLQFEIITPEPIDMAPGTLIDYRIKWRGIPIRWRTEIEVWEPPHRFVDNQLKGPYRLWHHEHRFEETPEGTMVHDTVKYAALGGYLAHRLVVDRDVRRIFGYRGEALREVFGF